MKTRRIAIAVLSFLGLLGTSAPAVAPPVNPLTLVGPVVPGGPVSFSVTGAPSNSTVRIVVIPTAAPMVVAGVPTAQNGFGCYFGSPTAVATFDGMTDSNGNLGPVVVWAASTPGPFTALLLQGPCAPPPTVTTGRIALAASDQRILAEDDFNDPVAAPALSVWGLAVLALALSAAGWAFLSRN